MLFTDIPIQLRSAEVIVDDADALELFEAAARRLRLFDPVDPDVADLLDECSKTWRESEEQLCEAISSGDVTVLRSNTTGEVLLFIPSELVAPHFGVHLVVTKNGLSHMAHGLPLFAGRAQLEHLRHDLQSVADSFFRQAGI